MQFVVSNTRSFQGHLLRCCCSCINTHQSAVQSLFQPDVIMNTATTKWHGIERGAGHVQGRDVQVAVSGRRVPKARQHSLHFVG